MKNNDGYWEVPLDLPIGEKLIDTRHDIKYIVVKDPKNKNCSICRLTPNLCYCVRCDKKYRKDGKNVIFKREEDD